MCTFLYNEAYHQALQKAELPMSGAEGKVVEELPAQSTWPMCKESSERRRESVGK